MGGGVSGLQFEFLDMSLVEGAIKFVTSQCSNEFVCAFNIEPEVDETIVGLDDGTGYPAFRRYGIEQF